MRPYTFAEQKVLDTLLVIPTPEQAAIIAGESGLSVKTVRDICNRLYKARKLTRTKLPGMGGPWGFAVK
jgi:hypothetical protein